MATIGTVTKHDDGHYEGELRTLSVRADITIMPVHRQGRPHPARLPGALQGRRDRCRLAAHRPDVGEGVRVAVDLRAELGSKTLYANLGRAAGETDPNVYALIWNPRE